jgi:uracil-DNA glycosylase family 4
MALPAKARTLARLHDEIVACRACPRLVAWREEVARVKRRAYRDEVYWGRAVPGFGDPSARIVVVGLAPGAHGANRTGRVFTGDRSGDFLFAALHRQGFASQPTSTRRDDGLTLRDVFILPAVRCVPPDNHPARDEEQRCAPFLDRELACLPNARVFLALGAIAFDATIAWHHRLTSIAPKSPRPRFSHGSELALDARRTLTCSYHVSQQNTQTGRLTPKMFDDVLERVRALAERSAVS